MKTTKPKNMNEATDSDGQYNKVVFWTYKSESEIKDIINEQFGGIGPLVIKARRKLGKTYHKLICQAKESRTFWGKQYIKRKAKEMFPEKYNKADFKN